jgi:hypothetical protein
MRAYCWSILKETVLRPRSVAVSMLIFAQLSCAREPSPANDPDYRLFAIVPILDVSGAGSVRMTDLSGEVHAIGPAIVDETDLEQAEALVDNEGLLLSIMLREAGAQRLNSATVHVRRLGLIVDSRLVSVVNVPAPLEGVGLWMGFAPIPLPTEDAHRVADALNDEPGQP